MIDDNRASYYVTMLHWPVVFVVITSSIDHPGRLTRQWELDVRYTMPSLSPSASVIIGQQATIVVSVKKKKISILVQRSVKTMLVEDYGHLIVYLIMIHHSSSTISGVFI